MIAPKSFPDWAMHSVSKSAMSSEDPTFAGLHPEPIQPWVDEGLAKVGELGYDALFINDGDADRIAAGPSPSPTGPCIP